MDEVFKDHILTLHGMPKSIISNHDPPLTTKFW
jgi:hypothetical protein